MRVVCFFCMLPESAGGAGLLHPVAPHHAVPFNTVSKKEALGPAAARQPASDGLARQQAVYDELLRSTDWARQPAQPKKQLRSARELTRELTGWSLPLPARRPAGRI